MKIYFKNRCLQLLKPDADFKGQIIVPESAQELEQILRDFEKRSRLSELALSSPDYKQLKRDIKSLFTIVEAAGGFVRNEKGEILFIFRRGKWDLPKGKIERRGEGRRTRDEGRRTREEERKMKIEHRKAEAVREVKEETGIGEVKVIRKMKPTYHVFHEKGVRMLKKSYWFEMTAPKDQKLVPQLEEDIRFVRWFLPEDLGIVLKNTFGSLREMVEENLHRLP